MTIVSLLTDVLVPTLLANVVSTNRIDRLRLDVPHESPWMLQTADLPPQTLWAKAGGAAAVSGSFMM